MDNNITPRANGLPPALASRVGNFLKSVAKVAQNRTLKGGLPILGLDKIGRPKYGQEDTLVRPGSLLAFNVFDYEWGWVAWKDSKPVGEVLVPGGQDLPDPRTLANHGVEWKKQYVIEGYFTEGPDKGVRVVYKPSSMGGTAALEKLFLEVARQVEIDPTKLIPIVEMTSKSYPNKKYGGDTWDPVFTVKGWGPTPAEGEAPRPPTPEPDPTPTPPPAAEAEAPANAGVGASNRRRRSAAA
jgi:hypothetical protein